MAAKLKIMVRIDVMVGFKRHFCSKPWGCALVLLYYVLLKPEVSKIAYDDRTGSPRVLTIQPRKLAANPP